MTQEELGQRFKKLAYELSKMEVERNRLARENMELKKELDTRDAYILKLRKALKQQQKKIKRLKKT